jgi:hypothetical protein
MIRSPLRILFDLCWQRVVVVCTSARQVRAFVISSPEKGWAKIA